MPLPNDVCRCHDSDCIERETCRRWLDRNKGSGSHVVHTNTLCASDGRCYSKIEVQLDNDIQEG